MSEHGGFFHKLDGSAILTVMGIILLFGSTIAVILVAPNFMDPSWVQPTSHYQVQMYEVADPNFYIARTTPTSDNLEYVHHLKKGYTLLSFEENEVLRIVAPDSLEKVITRFGDQTVKLTSQLLFLRTPQKAEEGSDFDPLVKAKQLESDLKTAWEKNHPDGKEKGLQSPDYQMMELYDPHLDEGFAIAFSDGQAENYIESRYQIVDPQQSVYYHSDPGVVFVKNPQEYRLIEYTLDGRKGHRYDPIGKPIASLAELTGPKLGFLSRKDLIHIGEGIYRIEGCWYCHTDQTRTLIQDTVLNGAESFAAPPSSANEYIYQYTTFAGTRRIGPDLSRVGVKRPSRDWHKSHFWSPKTASLGSIMPAFRHFFDSDPRGTGKNQIGIPNYRFEAIFQYLMTKGTRITPPTQAWWLGKDPIQTTLIIEGRSRLNAK